MASLYCRSYRHANKRTVRKLGQVAQQSQALSISFVLFCLFSSKLKVLLFMLLCLYCCLFNSCLQTTSCYLPFVILHQIYVNLWILSVFTVIREKVPVKQHLYFYSKKFNVCLEVFTVFSLTVCFSVNTLKLEY